MKIFAIKDAEGEPGIDLGYFFWIEKTNEYYIELNEELDEWDFPFILDSFARRGEWTVDGYHTELFIAQRIVPSDRQNIGAILKANGLETYDEVRLFLLADGRCAQDSCYIQPISREQLPDQIKRRRRKCISGAARLQSGGFLISFADGEIGLLPVEMQDAKEGKDRWEAQLRRTLAYAKGASELRIGAGGAELDFGGKKRIPYSAVAQRTIPLPVRMDELYHFALSNILTTQDMVDQLGCSRQNINDLVKRGRITPLPVNARVQLFPRSEYQKLL